MLKEFSVFILCSMAVCVLAKTQCKQNTECATDECCFYHEGPMVMSKKRDVLLPIFHGMVQGGWCEKYKQQGEYCSGIGKMNGHCECAPGLKCTWIKDPLLTLPTLQTLQPVLHAIQARSMMAGGHSECQPEP